MSTLCNSVGAQVFAGTETVRLCSVVFATNVGDFERERLVDSRRMHASEAAPGDRGGAVVAAPTLADLDSH